MKRTILAALLALAACSPSDPASRRDLPEAPPAAGVVRTPWRDPNDAPADEAVVVLWWDKDGKRLTRVVAAAPIHAQAYFDDAEVARIVGDKVRVAAATGTKLAVGVYARRDVQSTQAVHVANTLAGVGATEVRLRIEE